MLTLAIILSALGLAVMLAFVALVILFVPVGVAGAEQDSKHWMEQD